MTKRHGPDPTEASLDAVLRELQSEPRSAMIQREGATFECMADPFAHAIVLFGAGALGRFTLTGLREVGVQPLAFADNNPALWSRSVGGVQVLSPADAVARYGDKACFVVTVYHGSAVREQLRQAGCRKVIPFAPLFWRYSDVFIPSSGLELPHRILDRIDGVRLGYASLSDSASRQEFCRQLRWRCQLDYGGLSPHCHERDIYFAPDLITFFDGEVFVDCGAFDGDTVRSFLQQRHGTFGHIYAIEPDPANRLALGEFIQSLPQPTASRVTVLPYAVGSRNGAVGFRAESTAASRVAPGLGTEEVEVRRLDDLLADAGPTYIKMDVEGAEPEAIRGASRLLREHSPVLAACVYHRCEHLWTIPALIKSVAPEHNIFLRRYAEECWELVCYAVPLARLRQ